MYPFRFIAYGVLNSKHAFQVPGSGDGMRGPWRGSQVST